MCARWKPPTDQIKVLVSGLLCRNSFQIDSQKKKRTLVPGLADHGGARQDGNHGRATTHEQKRAALLTLTSTASHRSLLPAETKIIPVVVVAIPSHVRTVGVGAAQFRCCRPRHEPRGRADGLISSAPRKKDLLYQEDDRPRGGERSKYSGPNLPEDILCHIHSLMPLRDSASSACVSCIFLHSWRCYSKLTLTEKALGLTQKDGQKNIAMDFTSRVDHILKNHSGSGVKILKLVIPNYCNVNTGHLDNWLQNAITPGIEEVSLLLLTNHREEYSFPCSILHNGCGNSIQFLHLTYCSFRPMVGFDCLRSLTKLDLNKVRITGDELGFLTFNSFALEQLKLGVCNELMCIKIPFWLERLSYLSVACCKNLQVIESRAPKLSTFDLFGDPVQLSLGTQVKKLNVGLSYKPNIISYAITKLPSIMSHLETLTISSMNERISAPMVADKFLHLKYLKIFLYISFFSRTRRRAAYLYIKKKKIVSFTTWAARAHTPGTVYISGLYGAMNNQEYKQRKELITQP